MKNLFLHLTVLLFIFFAAVGCSDDESTIDKPNVEITSTEQDAEITFTTIKISGNVISDEGSEITARGVCWNTNSNPTIEDNKTEESTNSFTSLIENLTANTTYYFRVYATNSSGTGYSEETMYSTSTLDNTVWDFLLIHDSNTSWHADVTFNTDGSTVYDEPANPGDYTVYGTWSLNGNTLTYNADTSSTSDPDYYIFTGTLSGNTMSGTYTWDVQDKNWTATKY